MNAEMFENLVRATDHDKPQSFVVRDGHHAGTLFAWLGTEWIAVDLENRTYLTHCKRLAVVTLLDADPDDGLNQASLGCDLDCPDGEWVIDADQLQSLREIYGQSLDVLWEQK